MWTVGDAITDVVTPEGIAHEERASANRQLTPYVPRLVVDWLRDTPASTTRTVDGTLLFADISGFTRLSEALSRRGKVGAELMRDALNDVFTALLDDAYEYGAGLIKWGGDAVLLLFDGDEHGPRACRAAWEMQRTIERVGRLRAPGGTVVLRMSIGITSGPVEFFLVGSLHRELLVAGPTATETVAMEAIADAGEVALSPALAASLPPESRGAQKGGAILLAEPPAAARERAPDVGDVSRIDIASCIPVAARNHVLLDRSEPEHRKITAAFIDLIGTDALLAELGPAGVAAELDERLRTIQEAALRFEVPFYETDVGSGSVKALLTAGAPSGTGQDEERMLRALREIAETPGRIPLRVGVNTGKVFAGDFGPPYRRAYRVFGDAINTAARVMSRAEPGQILATDVVLAASRTVFETTPIQPFAAKGKALPIQASVIGPVAGARHASATTRFAGREPELEALLAAVDGMLRGEGWTMELSGRPGLGTSHLTNELVRRASGVRVVRARCDQYQTATPYYPMRAALRGALGLSAEAGHDETEAALRAAAETRLPHLVPWLPILAIPLGLELPPTPESGRLEERFLRERLAELTFELLAAVLDGEPALLLIEDGGHLDEATTALLLGLQAITEREGGRSWTLFLTRDEPVLLFGPGGDAVPWLGLCLLPLPLQRAREVVEQLSEDDPLAPHVALAIAERSGGNMAFLVELLEFARSGGPLESLPDSVETLVAAEIDRLAPRDRDVLRYASVLGTHFDPGLLADALRDELTLDTAVWARLSELVEPDPGGNRRFRNVLIRDAAYEGLPYRRRRQLHSWLAGAIEERAGDEAADEAATLALHHHEAQQWGRAWLYATQAAARATAVYANVEAAALWERALDSGRRLRPLRQGELAEAQEALGDVRFRLGEFDPAEHAFRAARRLYGSGTAAAGRIVLKEALIAQRFGNYPRTLRRLSRGLNDLEGARGRTAGASRARLSARYAAVRYRQNRPADAIDWCLRAEREARSAQARDALAQAYMIHDMALLARGRPDAARFSAKALALFEELGDLVLQAATLNNMGLLASEQGRWSEALDLYARAGEIWESTGDRWGASFASYNRGEILSDQGRFDDAERSLRGSLRVWRASGAAPEIAQATRQLGRLASRRGDAAAARDLLGAAREQQLANGELAEALWTEAWILEANLLGGDTLPEPGDVRELERRARDLDPDGRSVPLLARLLGWTLLVRGENEEAATAFEDGLTIARTRTAGFELAALLEGAVLAARAGSRAEPALEAELDQRLAELGMTVTPASPFEWRLAEQRVV